MKVVGDKWHMTGDARPVGRDSVEPSNERSEASAASISVRGWIVKDARCARAASGGKWGSTESRPTGGPARHLPPVTRHLSPRSAFTLIEVLIAVGILGLVMTAIYASWAAVLRASKTGNAAADEVQRMRIARQAVEQSLASAVLYAGNPRYYSFIADTTDEKFALLSFVAHLPQDFPGSGMFPNQPLRRVTFAVEPGTNSGPPALVLRQTSLLTPTNAPVEESYTLTLSRHLAIFGVEFWSTNLNDWDVEWLPTNQVPKMLRVTLGFGGDNRAGSTPAILVSSVISPGGQGVMRDLQMAGAPPGAGVGLPTPGTIVIPGQPGGGIPITLPPRHQEVIRRP